MRHERLLAIVLSYVALSAVTGCESATAPPAPTSTSVDVTTSGGALQPRAREPLSNEACRKLADELLIAMRRGDVDFAVRLFDDDEFLRRAGSGVNIAESDREIFFAEFKKSGRRLM